MERKKIDISPLQLCNRALSFSPYHAEGKAYESRQPEIFTVIIDKHNNLSIRVMTVRTDNSITQVTGLQSVSLC